MNEVFRIVQERSRNAGMAAVAPFLSNETRQGREDTLGAIVLRGLHYSHAVFATAPTRYENLKSCARSVHIVGSRVDHSNQGMVLLCR